MKFTHLEPADFKRLLALSEKKAEIIATIQAKLDPLDAEIQAIIAGSGKAAAAALPAEKPAKVKKVKADKKSASKRGPRGSLKTDIIALLEAAGADGITVKDIAAKLKKAPQNVHVWFSNTGKKVATKVAPGRYKLTGSTAAAAVEAPEAPAKVKAAKPVKFKKAKAKKAA